MAGERTLSSKAGWTKAPGDPDWHREVRIQLAPALYPDINVPGLRIQRSATNCRYAWTGTSSPPREALSNHEITSADGVMLVDGQRPSAEAVRLGLVPLIGFGHRDYDSLIGLLGRSRRLRSGLRAKLTIKASLQRLAVDVLAERMAAYTAEQTAQRPRDRRASQRTALEQEFQVKRRAALVVLDGATGNILAAAGHPTPPDPAQFTAWDLEAFAYVYPLEDPFTVRAWQSRDRHYAPGSTFKVAVALAALAAAKTNPHVDAMLRGWREGEFEAQTGLKIEDRAYGPYQGLDVPNSLQPWIKRSIPNFPGEKLWDSLYHVARDGRQRTPRSEQSRFCVEGPVPRTDALGLVPAMRDSVNIWFAYLGMLLDGQSALTYDRDFRFGAKTPVPSLRLAATMRRLGLITPGPIGLLNGKPADIWGDIFADAGQADIVERSPPWPLRWMVAQTSIGQGLQLTPLHLAALAATVASGHHVHPRLVLEWDGRAVEDPPITPLDLPLDLLRRGMKAVPEVGTAKGAFCPRGQCSPLACRTWGKTGTAEVGQRKGVKEKRYKTAWFMGWYRPPEYPKRHELAFACLVTHVHSGRDTGGEVCAPIVRAFLERMETPPASDPPQTASQRLPRNWHFTNHAVIES